MISVISITEIIKVTRGGKVETKKTIALPIMIIALITATIGVINATQKPPKTTPETKQNNIEPAEVTHFTMVFPGGDMNVTPEDFIATEEGETKEIIIAWGHPYEHILIDCPENLQVHVRKPDGTVKKLTPTETTIQGKKAYKVSYKVNQMGDSIIYVRLVAPEHGLIDYTKTFIHYGTEQWKGWNAEVGQEAEIIPYTRPYGMEEGFVFNGKALYNGQKLSNATVEVEKYHQEEKAEEVVSEAEEKYPYDPPMMYTRQTKTNSNGEFSYTLDEPGIWYVGATKEVENGYPRRGVFQLPILEEFPSPSESVTDSAGASSTLVYSGIAVAVVAIILAIIVTRYK